MIEAIYKEPIFIIKDGKTQTKKRTQMAGIRQGCPLSPYLFILLLITITHDFRNNLDLQENIDIAEGQLHKASLSELYYADDTLVMTSTAKAAETIRQHIEQESEKYNMKLNYDKCIHLRMNDIRTITYKNGQDMPRKTEAIYLGGKIFADGSYNKKNQTQNHEHMGHCQKTGSTLEKGTRFTQVETTSLRRSHYLKTTIRTRNNPVHRTELQPTRCLPVQRTQKNIRNQTFLLVRSQKQTCSPDSKQES